ncbi:MAG: hypothetical protein C4K49_06925 [Candidatus Thorarchaeota archaeon]|nr:MAG: hypothetical protein C4K49_06925 [Candidatus Thorarchaeota archaeon]
MPVKIDIVRQRENKVLKRREIDFRIDHVGGTTPTRADIRAKLAAQLNSDPSAVVIRRLWTKYGIGITDGVARIYDDAAQAKSIEIAYVLKRHEPKKKEEAGEEAEKPAKEKAPEKAGKAEKKKPEKKAEKETEEPETAEKRPERAEKAEKRPEKPEKAEKKPEKETEKAEKKSDKKKKAEAADEDKDEEES